MEVLSRSSVTLDLRFFGGGERACGVDERRASGVGGIWKSRSSQKIGKEGSGKAVGPEKMITGGRANTGGTKCEERKVKRGNERCFAKMRNEEARAAVASKLFNKYEPHSSLAQPRTF
jgi:hypothetical protein